MKRSGTWLERAKKEEFKVWGLNYKYLKVDSDQDMMLEDHIEHIG